MFAADASADTVAETAGAWGLIGSWSLDCSVAPDRGKGAVLAYEIAPGDRVIHRRDFGDTSDESEVITAEVSRNGMLNLRVFFPNLKQTREYGFVMEPDGTLRAVYTRSQQGPKSPNGRRPWLPSKFSRPRFACSLPAQPSPMTPCRAPSPKTSGFPVSGWRGSAQR